MMSEAADNGQETLPRNIESARVSTTPMTQPAPGGNGNGGSARTGVTGLDDVLADGVERSRVYLLEGCPGSGKK